MIGKNYRARFITTLTILISIFTLNSCNLYSSLDPPIGADEKYQAAIDFADKGDCDSAYKLLKDISNPNDKQRVATGWALLCLAGASTKTVATTLYSFSSSSADLTVIGSLARAMDFVTDIKLGYIELAISYFNGISIPSVKNIEVAIAKIVKTAGIMAFQRGATLSPRLIKRHIADASCDAVAADCAAGCAVDTTLGTMSASHVTSIINTISEATTSLGSTGAADLSTLASTINTGLAGGTNAARCYIYKNLMPAD